MKRFAGTKRIIVALMALNWLVMGSGCCCRWFNSSSYANTAGLLHTAGCCTHHVLRCRHRRGTYGCASPLYSGAGCYSAALLPLPVPIARFDQS